MAAPVGPGQSGFEPRTSPAERRDFFDLRRQIKELQEQVADLKQRVSDLENP